CVLVMSLCLFFLFFFFSSRRRHTRLQGDWSSDVCSSDLPSRPRVSSASLRYVRSTSVESREGAKAMVCRPFLRNDSATSRAQPRSEERRVGKECRSRW